MASYNVSEHDNDMLNFGKFKNTNKTYKQIYENKRDYCDWVISQTTPCKPMKAFQKYIQTRRLICDENEEFVRYETTKASHIYSILTDFLTNHILQYMNIIEHIKPHYAYNYLDRMKCLEKLSPSEQGILADYTIRYMIAKRLDLHMTDGRAECFKGFLGDSYTRFKDLAASPQDIYVVSMAHKASFSEIPIGKFKDLIEAPKIIFPNDFKFEGVDEWIESNIKPELKVIEFNLSLGNSELAVIADADLILDENEIIDIKFVERVDTPRYFVQLLTYAACYKVVKNKYVSYMRYVNFKSGEEYKFSVTPEAIDDMISILKDSAFRLWKN